MAPREISRRYHDARSAGWHAGGDVGLHHGVDAEGRPAMPAAPKLIGSGHD
ncbi:hypothetical protein [Methylobrevis pamukkalensis]|uniref:hypothetical protein n=1 Tax=Methylobrevis pamukkalensis TaxID=1439726 RepID=UPI001472488B|nr:hypothetical protein [Methylobrevis pamukkalensis]